MNACSADPRLCLKTACIMGATNPATILSHPLLCHSSKIYASEWRLSMTQSFLRFTLVVAFRRFSFILGNWFRRFSAVPSGFFTRIPERPPLTVDNSPHLIMNNSPSRISSVRITHYRSHTDVSQPTDPQPPTISSRSRTSQPETSTSDSVHPPRKGKLLFSAMSYCSVLFNNPEANRTMIYSVSLWVDAEGIPHRFLTMHATRLPDLEYYIRLDRRRAHNQPSVTVSSQSEASDEVTLSRELDHLLVGKPVKELSRIIFPVPATLGDVSMVLQAVCESYPHYALSAENCWWWSSTIQHFLHLQHGGVPSLLYRGAGSDERIATRLRELRDSGG
ncbi:uncharacterized protein EI90DRAFT_3027107 [Cantharellus anzutake]|uniref:uncharacterized protein n=1 Tax=Cantharellus anzutake TaxID=1750568 RepID=UPI001904BFDF|nr:uncharacterized protein EI90DRAFT_3027107 [Cantharellus anzutake]KAF8343786.1 hypothetical protein EI90DRAFT_3027107 [Cantharellus anzutake]